MRSSGPREREKAETALLQAGRPVPAWDFFEDPVGLTDRILPNIRQHNVNLVVLNAYPQFSGPLPADLRAALELEFPNRAETGKFEVRWKP